MMKRSHQKVTIRQGSDSSSRQPRRENDSETLCSVAGFHACPCTEPEQRGPVFVQVNDEDDKRRTAAFGDCAFCRARL
jgi:hypothetical protein